MSNIGSEQPYNYHNTLVLIFTFCIATSTALTAVNEAIITIQDGRLLGIYPETDTIAVYNAILVGCMYPAVKFWGYVKNSLDSDNHLYPFEFATKTLLGNLSKISFFVSTAILLITFTGGAESLKGFVQFIYGVDYIRSEQFIVNLVAVFIFGLFSLLMSVVCHTLWVMALGYIYLPIFGIDVKVRWTNKPTPRSP